MKKSLKFLKTKKNILKTKKNKNKNKNKNKKNQNQRGGAGGTKKRKRNNGETNNDYNNQANNEDENKRKNKSMPTTIRRKTFVRPRVQAPPSTIFEEAQRHPDKDDYFLLRKQGIEINYEEYNADNEEYNEEHNEELNDSFENEDEDESY
jgi:hypothetical protein